MERQYSIPELRNLCSNAEIFPPEVINWIEQENLWNLWVPKIFGGLELSFSEGLQRLKELARIDGSLGWTVTLCSGANYFMGNLKPEISKKIFLDKKTMVCFGGSGGVFGTAEKRNDHYLLSGLWRYATGAPYLTHFTLNAKILENGNEVIDSDGSAVIRSFVVPREDVEIITDWDSMGLRATATHSFKVNEKSVHEDYSFVYNQFYLPHPIFKISFSVFADLTLWANYLGMAQHFLEEGKQLLKLEKTMFLTNTISKAAESIMAYSKEIEQTITSGKEITTDRIQNIHETAADSVRQLSQGIIEVYPYVGVKPTKKDQPINQVFRDYFTATQHHIFTK